MKVSYFTKIHAQDRNIEMHVNKTSSVVQNEEIFYNKFL